MAYEPWGLPALSALLLSATSLSAQTLGGTVVNALTGAPVVGARITALDARGTAHGTIISDSTGTFHIPLPRADRYQLHADRDGYAVQTSDFIRVRRGEAIAVELKIGPQVAALAPLVVVARRRHPVSRLNEFYDRMERQKKIGLGCFLTRADIEQTSSIDVHALLEREPSIAIVRVKSPPSNLSPGAEGPPDPIDLLRSAANVRRTGASEIILFNRRGGTGGGPCTPMIFLDGIPLGRAEYVQLTSFVSVDEIEGIEMYRSGIETPGELADGCGAIGVWTRRTETSHGNPFSLRRIGIAAGIVAGGLVLLSLIPN